jgi:hypothetical protein
VFADEFALLPGFAIAVCEFARSDFGKVDGVICARLFVGYAV